jgi:hypothetical protein
MGDFAIQLSDKYFVTSEKVAKTLLPAFRWYLSIGELSTSGQREAKITIVQG